jgi:hypothetical protein
VSHSEVERDCDAATCFSASPRQPGDLTGTIAIVLNDDLNVTNPCA